jgi:hypothetical protein
MASSRPDPEQTPQFSDCCRTAHFWEGQPKGREIRLGKFDVYEASPKTTSSSNEACILFLHDAFGWKFVNNRFFADQLSDATGFKVLVLEYVSLKKE